jgi:hypothetical protein
MKNDVMRKPEHINYYAIATGTGTQVVFCYFLLLAFSYCNLLSHLALRPLLWWSMLCGLACTGFINGFATVLCLKLFDQTREWKQNVGLTAVWYPGFVVTIISLIDVLEWVQWSHEEYSFSTLLSGLCLWLIIGVPVTYVGGCLGMKF